MTGTYIVGLLALLGPVITYLGLVRRASGRIRTSDAAQLWEESRSIRVDLRADKDALEKRIVTLETQVRDLVGANQGLQQENERLHLLVDKHERTIKRLTAENERLKKRVEELESAGG